MDGISFAISEKVSSLLVITRPRRLSLMSAQFELYWRVPSRLGNFVLRIEETKDAFDMTAYLKLM